MAHSIQIKEKAMSMRKEGVSIPNIAKKLLIAKSTISVWVSPVPLPEEIRRRLRENSQIANEKGREVMRVRRILQRDDDRLKAIKLIAALAGGFDKNFWKLSL